MKTLFPLFPLLALAAVACGEKDHEHTGHTDDTGTDDTGEVQHHDTTAVVATVSADYSAGALTTISLNAEDVDDQVALATDANVTSGGGWLFALNRVDNSVRVYTPGSWDTPYKEFAVGVNPQQTIVCKDKLFVTMYGEDHVGIYNIDSGALAGSVDISSYDTHGDGTPEASSAVVLDDTLYVGLENQDETWTGIDGQVIAIDCASEQVSGSWPVGGNATISLAGDTLVARWGNWYNPDYSVAIDGEVGVLDPDSGFSAKLSEEELDLNLQSVAFNDEGFGVLLGTSTDGTDSYSVHCVDVSDWSMTKLADMDEFVSDAVANSEGEIWLATRPHWINGGEGGIYRIDPKACAFVGDPIATTLPPSALTFY